MTWTWLKDFLQLPPVWFFRNNEFVMNNDSLWFSYKVPQSMPSVFVRMWRCVERQSWNPVPLDDNKPDLWSQAGSTQRQWHYSLGLLDLRGNDACVKLSDFYSHLLRQQMASPSELDLRDFLCSAKTAELLTWTSYSSNNISSYSQTAIHKQHN